MSDFLSLETVNDDLLIKIDLKNKNIDISKDIDLSKLDAVKNKNVTINGRGPVELFAMLSYYAIIKECKSLTIYEYNTDKNFCIYDCNENISNGNYPYRWFSEAEKIIKIEKASETDGKWDLDKIKDELKCCKISNIYNPLIITGSGSLLFYAILGASAAISGYKNVFINKPTLKNLISIVQGTNAIAKDENVNGKVIGILGDPNNGKSVFAKMFESVMRFYIENNENVWCCDCDEAAKTPDWFVYGLQNAKSSEQEKNIKETRNQLKKDWTLELEYDVVDYLNNTKKCLNYIVADMPGGLHKEDKNIHKRIPDIGRSEMLATCDYLIILSRKDKPYLYDEWIKALKEYNLENKVIAEIVSGNYDAQPKAENAYFDDNGIFHVTIHGLNRNTKRSDLVESIKDSLKVLCEKIK